MAFEFDDGYMPVEPEPARYWKPEVGARLTGVYKVIDGRMALVGDNGMVMLLPDHKVLSRLLGLVQQGDSVQIICTGDGKDQGKYFTYRVGVKKT